MLEGISSEFIGGVLLGLLIYLTGSFRPIAERMMSAWWRWLTPRIVACCTAHWRKAAIALTAVWVMGGFLAYALAGGMNDAAPLWAISWFGSVMLFLWGCAAWHGGLAIRWLMRRIRLC